MDYYKLKVLNNKRKIIITLIVLIILGGFTFYYFYYYKDKDIETILMDKEEVSDQKLSNIDNDKLIFVDIKGYVATPGVYSFKLNDDARINDLIIKAGGLKKDADTSILNLSKKLEDEMTIIIYSKSEVENYVKTQELLKNKLEVCEIKLKNNACIKEEKNEKENSNLKININNATKEELMTLNGIGESKALAIIEYRKNKPFQDINDLLNVEGIGESLFESIKENIDI